MSISIHALLAESDLSALAPKQNATQFLSTLSLRRATQIASNFKHTQPAISIHALLAESDNGHETSPYRVVISIHALLAESDGQAQSLKVAALRISIHALLAESDITLIALSTQPTRFLSTLSLRRATYYCSCTVHNHRFLSTLSLRRATYGLIPPITFWTLFLSTLSLRRATGPDLPGE